MTKMLAEILTYDFCPWANRWVAWLKHPAATLGLAALAALACAIFVERMGFVAFIMILLVALLGILWPSISIRGLSGELSFRQERVTEGQSARIVVKLQNRCPWPIWGLTVEWGPTDSEKSDFAKVPAWSSCEFEWAFTPTSRGEFPRKTPRLTTGFPFGLRSASRAITTARTLLVWPQVIPLETLLDAAETRPSDEQFSEHRVGESGDVTGTRLFRTGDSLRRVHWAQTARQSKMIVTERQVPIQSSLRVVFDSDVRLHKGERDGGTLEWSIRLAASICAAYHRENSQVECCFDHEVLPINTGPKGLVRFLDTLARWKPASDSPATPGHHQHSGRDCRRIHHRHCGAFQVTITTDLGLAHRTEHRHVHGDQRTIVLKTSAFDDGCSICGETHSRPGHLAIVLDSAGSIVPDFKRQWRHVCHAG